MINLISKLFLVIRTIENFPLAILDRLGFLKGKMLYRMRNGTKFIARRGTEDLSEIAVVASGSEYDFKSVSLPNNPTIIDLGGHIGTFSVLSANQFKNKCKIYTYEPEKENFKILIQNLKINNVTSVIARNLAISNFEGRGFLKTENMNTDAYYLDILEKKEFNCNVSTLPYEFKKNKIKKIDLMKMDIEGGEYAILSDPESMRQILSKVHFIFIEVGPAYFSSEMKKIIEKNFKLKSKHNNVLALENLNWKND